MGIIMQGATCTGPPKPRPETFSCAGCLGVFRFENHPEQPEGLIGHWCSPCLERRADGRS